MGGAPGLSFHVRLSRLRTSVDWMYRNEPGGVAPLGPLVDRLFLERPTVRAARNRRGLLAEEIALALGTEHDMNRLFDVSSFARPCSEIRFEEEGNGMDASHLKG